MNLSSGKRVAYDSNHKGLVINYATVNALKITAAATEWVESVIGQHEFIKSFAYLVHNMDWLEPAIQTSVHLNRSMHLCTCSTKRSLPHETAEKVCGGATSGKG